MESFVKAEAAILSAEINPVMTIILEYALELHYSIMPGDQMSDAQSGP